MYKYNKTTWKNKEQDPKGGTPLSAANFNNMEEGIEQAHIKADRIETTGLGYKALFDDGVYKFPPEGIGNVLTTGSDDYVCFTATEDTSTFTIQTTSDSTVTLLKENLEMVKDVDYTINKDTGVVSLNFILKKDEKIYYKVEEHISVSDMATVSDLYKHAESSEPHKNVIGTDTLTTSAKTVKEAINEVNNETINKIIISDSKPENMVKNTFYLENRDVVREGLVEELHNCQFDGTTQTSKTITNVKLLELIKNKKPFNLFFNIIVGEANNSPLSILPFSLDVNNKFNFGEDFTNNKSSFICRYANALCNVKTKTINVGENIFINVSSDGNFISINVNEIITNLDISDLEITENISQLVLGYSNGWKSKSKILSFLAYDRQLSQEEVKYNFHANGEDKVATIEDADGRVYNFSTKSQNVFCKNGSNLDAAMNQFISWKELTMNGDGTFPLTKCADWYSYKIYIEGQTVKNIANIGTDIRTDYYKTINHNNNWALYDIPYIDLDRSKKYIIRYEVIENTLSVDFLLASNVSVNPVFGDYSFRIKKGETGIFEKEISPSLNNTDMLLRMQVYSNSGVGKIVLRCTITEEKLNAYIPFGLASLGDTKGGRTYISLESNGYENKIEVTEPLRKVGDVADAIDGNVLTRKIKEITKDDILDLKLNNVNYLNVGNFYLTIQPCLTSYGICNILDRQTTLISDTSTSGFLLADSKTLFIRLKDITTVEEAKKWLYDNNFQLQYQLATPTVEQVKSTFVYTPNQNGECNFKFNNAVAPSNSRIQVAQTTNQALDEIKTAIISLGGAL